MSFASRLFLAPLIVLSFASACDAGSDDFDSSADAELDAEADALRSGTAFFTGTFVNNPQSGIRINTNNMGNWLFSTFNLSGQMHEHLRLREINIAGFGSNRPGWEHDDLPSGLSVDSPNDHLQLDVSPEHMLIGTADGMFLQHGDFHDSLWTIEVDHEFIPDLDHAQIDHTNGILTMRLEVSWQLPEGIEVDVQGNDEDLDEQTIVAQGGVPIYTFWYGQAGESVSTCSSQYVEDHHGTGAVFFRDLDINQHDGIVTHESDLLYIACTKGAVGKVASKWGYWPSEMDIHSHPGDERTEFETAVRMVRADYCGDGVSWTVPGTQVEVFDSLPHTPTSDTANDFLPQRPVIEAVWEPGGASCVDYPRVAGNYPPCAPPPCNDSASAFHWLQYMNAPFLTRTDRITEHNPTFP